MNNAELDRLFEHNATKIVPAEMTAGPGPLPHGVFEQAPRVITTPDRASPGELLSCTHTNDRSVPRNSSA